MGSFTNIVKDRGAIASSMFPGIFYNDPPLEQISHMLELVQSEDEEANEKLVLWFFQDIVVDEVNDPLTDMQTLEDIQKQQASIIRDMVAEFVEHVSPTDKKK